jgi:Carboxypeptidase regulatory-like domain
MRMHRCIVVASVLLLTCTHVDAQSRAATGALAGCITDTNGYPLPGVTIDVSAKAVHRTLSSNATGCYELTGLPPGLYVVFAGAPGFGSVTRDQIAVSRGRIERRDLEMHVRAICECVGPLTVAEQWKEADAVVRLRITGHEQGPSRIAGLFPYIKHTATVRSVLKRHPMIRSTSSTLTFLQVPEGEEQEPFAIGQEFVIFLGWAPTQGAFVMRTANDRNEAAAFAIEDGRIHSA